MNNEEIFRKHPFSECPEYDECCRNIDYRGTDLQCEYCDVYWESIGVEKPMEFELGW